MMMGRWRVVEKRGASGKWSGKTRRTVGDGLQKTGGATEDERLVVEARLGGERYGAVRCGVPIEG